MLPPDWVWWFPKSSVPGLLGSRGEAWCSPHLCLDFVPRIDLGGCPETAPLAIPIAQPSPVLTASTYSSRGGQITKGENQMKHRCQQNEFVHAHLSPLVPENSQMENWFYFSLHTPQHPPLGNAHHPGKQRRGRPRSSAPPLQLYTLSPEMCNVILLSFGKSSNSSWAELRSLSFPLLF